MPRRRRKKSNREFELRNHRRRKARSNASPRFWVGLREWLRDGRLVGALLTTSSALLLGFLFFSPQFQIEEVEILGNQALPESDAIAQSEAQGTNLFLLDANAVVRRLLEIPYVEQVRVERTLPNQIRLRVTEAFPSVSWCLLHGSERYLVNDDGLVLGREQPEVTDLIYIVDVEDTPVSLGDNVEPEAVRTAQQVFSRLYNDMGIALLPFEYQEGLGITAVAVEGWRARFGDSTHLEQKVRNLAALLQSGIEFSLVDLRLPDQMRYQ